MLCYLKCSFQNTSISHERLYSLGENGINVAFTLPLFELIHASTVLMPSVLTCTPAVGLVSEENTTSFNTVKNILDSEFSRSSQKHTIKPAKWLGFPEQAQFLHDASQI